MKIVFIPVRPWFSFTKWDSFFFLFDSVLHPFQDYFTHRDKPIGRCGKTGVPPENNLTHPQAELGLFSYNVGVYFHIWSK